MSDHGRRLDRLEVIWGRPVEPTGPPCDMSRLTPDELGELEELDAAMRAVDVPPGLDRRSDVRVRLDALSDEELARLEWLQGKACSAPVSTTTTETTDAVMD